MIACSRLSSAVGMGWVGVGWGLLLRVWGLRVRGGCGIDALCKVVGGWCKTGDVLYPGMIARSFLVHWVYHLQLPRSGIISSVVSAWSSRLRA
jgi:hypothetical protein